MQLRAAIAAARAEDIAGQTFAVDAHEHVLLPGDVAAHEREMMLAVDLGAIQMQIELAVIGGHLHDLDALDQFLALRGGI